MPISRQLTDEIRKPIEEAYRERIDEIIGRKDWVFECTRTSSPYFPQYRGMDDFKWRIFVKDGTIGELRDAAGHRIYDEENKRYKCGPVDLVVARFEILCMINCCGIGVSTHAFVVEEFRKKGLGTLLQQLRIELARNAGYGLLLCTDAKKNTPERKILAKNGWTDIFEFNNPRSGNDLAISVVKL